MVSFSAGFQLRQHVRQSLWVVPLIGTVAGGPSSPGGGLPAVSPEAVDREMAMRADHQGIGGVT
jgi:hypothetical protein